MAFRPLDVIHRDKNLQCLIDLGLTPVQRSGIISDLRVENYSSGPSPDDTDASKDVWVFGADVEGTEVYIKLRLNLATHKGKFDQAIVWSFHKSEHALKYPFQGGGT